MGNEDRHEPAPATSADGADRKAERRELSSAARRALAEAEERRARRSKGQADEPAEFGGQGGPDPVRYGDWEKGGIISDF